MSEGTNASVQPWERDPWPSFADPRTNPEMHTQACLDYAEQTSRTVGQAFCLAECADERRTEEDL